MKKILSTILCLVMLLAFLPSAYAVEQTSTLTAGSPCAFLPEVSFATADLVNDAVSINCTGNYYVKSVTDDESNTTLFNSSKVSFPAVSGKTYSVVFDESQACIEIAGIQIYESGMVSGAGINGTVSYNKSENKLTVNNASINGGIVVPDTNTSELIIEVTGDTNNIQALAGEAFKSSKDVRIQGTGSIRFTGISSYSETDPDEGYPAFKAAKLTADADSIIISAPATDEKPARTGVALDVANLDVKSGRLEVVTADTDKPAISVADGVTVYSSAIVLEGSDSAHAEIKDTPEYNKAYECIRSATLTVTPAEGLNLNPDATGKFTAAVDPAGTISYVIAEADKEFISIDSDGNVTAKKAKETPITVTVSANKQTVTRTVSVTEAAKSITLDKSTLTLNIGDEYTLVPTTTPAGQTVEFSSDTPTSVTVDTTSGKLKAVAANSNPTKITAKIAGTEIKAECLVTVKPVSAESVTITTPSTKNWAFTGAGLTGTFKATVSPAYSDENSNIIKWTSSNENVVKLASTEANGTVAHFYSVGSGTATVTATCGTKSDTMSVTVASDYKFTSPTGKLIFYYDSASKNDCTFTTNIPAAGVRKVAVNGYDLTSCCSVSSSTGTITIPYSTLYGTFGRQTSTMTLKVYYTDSSYIEKPLYYRSIYDSPLTADGDMTWAYITMLFSGIAIASSTFVLRKIKRSH